MLLIMPAIENACKRIGVSFGLICCIMLSQPLLLHAQSKAILKAAQRYEIEAKRMGVDAGSEDALPRSREFKRIDSSYYVGWFYEGIYKLNHAADYLGYHNAIEPLEKALWLLERDYAKELRTRSNNFQIYFPVYAFQMDYSRIGAALRECYANTEQPEKVVALMRRSLSWKFQRELYLDAYNYLSWTTHRYRFYTSEKYSFLKATIDENEQLAMRYLDSNLRLIQKNKKFNDGLFRPGYDLGDMVGVYHYKCILYSYAFNIDSAEKYFAKMKANNALPHNNYANFKSVIGDFRSAEKEYQLASSVDNGDKRLQEWAYYSSILSIGKAKPKEGIALCNDMIQGFGSTPGFGWYNIALARALVYDGQVTASQKALSKAANFKELHIGTTLGQSHYDFSIQLLQLIQQEQKIAMLQFEHKNWWYHPGVLAQIASLSAERLMRQYFIVNQFAQNPERDRVVYKLFSTESTVSWDEIWYLIKDFSSAFFVKRFEQELKINQRKPISKYFKLFVARLKIKQGDYAEARRLLHEILQDTHTDKDYEQLFLARSYQAFAECALKEDDLGEAQKWTQLMLATYPQLIPFSGLKPAIRLEISGLDPAVLKVLKGFNFDLDHQQGSAIAKIAFLTKGNKKSIRYDLRDTKGRFIVPSQTFSYKDAEKAGLELAYRLFGVGGETSVQGNEATHKATN